MLHEPMSGTSFKYTAKPGEVWVVTVRCAEHKRESACYGHPFRIQPGSLNPCSCCTFEKLSEA